MYLYLHIYAEIHTYIYTIQLTNEQHRGWGADLLLSQKLYRILKSYTVKIYCVSVHVSVVLHLLTQTTMDYVVL